jgi:hypothetical protein
MNTLASIDQRDLVSILIVLAIIGVITYLVRAR